MQKLIQFQQQRSRSSNFNQNSDGKRYARMLFQNPGLVKSQMGANQLLFESYVVPYFQTLTGQAHMTGETGIFYSKSNQTQDYLKQKQVFHNLNQNNGKKQRTKQDDYEYVKEQRSYSTKQMTFSFQLPKEQQDSIRKQQLEQAMVIHSTFNDFCLNNNITPTKRQQIIDIRSYQSPYGQGIPIVNTSHSQRKRATRHSQREGKCFQEHQEQQATTCLDTQLLATQTKVMKGHKMVSNMQSLSQKNCQVSSNQHQKVSKSLTLPLSPYQKMKQQQLFNQTDEFLYQQAHQSATQTKVTQQQILNQPKGNQNVKYSPLSLQFTPLIDKIQSMDLSQRKTQTLQSMNTGIHKAPPQQSDYELQKSVSTLQDDIDFDLKIQEEISQLQSPELPVIDSFEVQCLVPGYDFQLKDFSIKSPSRVIKTQRIHQFYDKEMQNIYISVVSDK